MRIYYFHIVNVNVLVTQLCLTLCDPMGCSPPGSSVHGILQARILEWVAISFSRGSSQPRDWTPVSCIAGRLFIIWATKKWPASPGFCNLSGLEGPCCHSPCINPTNPTGPLQKPPSLRSPSWRLFLYHQWEEPFFWVLMSFSRTMLIAAIPFILLK